VTDYLLSRHLFVGLILLALICNACGEGASANLAREGDSCAKTSDCEGGLKCISFLCGPIQVDIEVVADEEEEKRVTTCNSDQCWADPTTGMIWENPAVTTKVFLDEAHAYCDGLDLDGHYDWRVPTVGELRTLVWGCVETEPGGECNIGGSDCKSFSCREAACSGCPSGNGPADGCYWPDEMQGTCGHYWSSSTDKSSGGMVFCVNFETGYIGTHCNHVRCVR
jgi:hypothetical protein